MRETHMIVEYTELMQRVWLDFIKNIKCKGVAF